MCTAVVFVVTSHTNVSYADMFNDYEVDGRKLEVRYDRMN